MAETLQTFLDDVHAAARLLGEPATLELIAGVRQQSGSAPPRLLVVGTPGSGRFSLVNALLGQPELLPASPIPRTPLPILIRHGETPAAELLEREGIGSLLPLDQLRGVLSSSDSSNGAAGAMQINIAARSPLLHTSELRIETIGAQRTPNEWKERLAATDYVLLVLNALALLSEQERRFVRDLLHGAFGLERVAIIVNQMDQVAADEQEAVLAQVRTFLGPFERQPVLIPFSAARVLESLAAGEQPTDSGYTALLRLVREDLLGRHRQLRAAALRQAAETCLSELETAVQREQTLLNTSEAELRQVLDRLDPQSDWLAERTERTQRRVEAFVNTLIKEQTLREIEAFGSTLREQLPDEVRSVADVAAIKRHLPGYVEALWQDFFRYEMPLLRSTLLDEMQQITDSIADDLRELAGDPDAPLHEQVDSFDPMPPGMKAFVMPARGQHPAGNAATWMQFGGLTILIPAQLLLPQIGLILSLGLIGGGQAVRMAFQRDIASADRQAIGEAAVNAVYDLEKQLKRQIGNHFQGLNDQLRQSVADLYQQGIAQLRAGLADSIARRAELEARRADVEQLAAEHLPALRQRCDQLMGGRI